MHLPGQGHGLSITATGVTPEIVRVIFLNLVSLIIPDKILTGLAYGYK